LNRITLATPFYRDVPGEYFRSFLTMRKPPGLEVLTYFQRHLIDAQNALVRLFLDLPPCPETRYLCFLEQDMLPPPDFLIRAQSYEVPVVGALYFSRYAERCEPLAGCFKDSGGWRYLGEPEVEAVTARPGLHPVDWVGMGCTFIREDVLRGWPESLPWFAMPILDPRGIALPSDIYFCYQARSLGIPVFVDSGLLCKHMGERPVGIDQYRQARAATRPAMGALPPVGR
jgi:hypothetical protein